MAQSNIIVREQAVYTATETAFGVTPSGTFPEALTRTILSEPVVIDGAARELLDVNDIRVRRLDTVLPVQGLELASKVKLAMMLKATPSSAQLTSGTSAALLTPRIWLTHALGRETSPTGGSVVATGTSATQFDVSSGHGSRFTKGTYIGVTISGQVEWALVTNISTDTLTVSPALSGAPATSAIVRNLYNYAPAESHTNSMCVQVAYVGDTAAQYTFNGCHGDVSFKFGEWGKLAFMELALDSVNYTGPTAQSLSVATAADEMGAGFPLAPSVYLATGSAPTRATTLVCESFSVEYKNKWEMVRDPAATQTVSGVVNTAGRPRSVKIALKLRFDSSYPTAFDADTRYTFTMVQTIGTGSTRSFWIINANNVTIAGTPKLSKVGERLYMDLELNAYQDDAVTLGSSSGTALDAIYAPMRVAFG